MTLGYKEMRRQMARDQCRQLAERQNWRCPWCSRRIRRDLRDTQKDHIIPVVRGGPDVDWNWQILHSGCNNQKREFLTEQAIALAAEHGITLLPPVVRPPRASRYTSGDMAKMRARRAAGESYDAIAADYGCAPAWARELIRRTAASGASGSSVAPVRPRTGFDTQIRRRLTV